MRHLLLPTALLCLSLNLPTARAEQEPERDTLFQLSTINALLAGVYQPLATLDAVLTQGDFGLGTFAGLDGELILLDGIVYQAGADGRVRIMPGETATPFISLTWFEADQSLPVPPNQDYAAFKDWLQGQLPSRNLTYAIQLKGQFAHVRYRSVPPQQPPYPPLKEVAKQQTLFERDTISGTLIGFWCPDYVTGLNVPGFHLHFLSDDRQSAGHLLDFQLTEGEVALDLTDRWTVELPEDPAFLAADLDTDRSRALHQVEQAPDSQKAQK